jgi:hypothetical protein
MLAAAVVQSSAALAAETADRVAAETAALTALPIIVQRPQELKTLAQAAAVA